MTPAEMKTAQKQLGVTQAGLAGKLEVSDRTIRRYASGKWNIPRGIEYAIYYLLHLQKMQQQAD